MGTGSWDMLYIFSTELWMCCIIITLLTGLVMGVFEHGIIDGWWYRKGQTIWESTWSSVHNIIGHFLNYDMGVPQSGEGRILLVAYGLFVWAVEVYYTCVSTTAALKMSSVTNYNDITEMVKDQAKLCVTKADK